LKAAFLKGEPADCDKRKALGARRSDEAMVKGESGKLSQRDTRAEIEWRMGCLRERIWRMEKLKVCLVVKKKDREGH